jgi:hypothetical protein
MIKRPLPAAAALMDKEEFAASMIAEEHDSFGCQDTEMLEEHFEEITQNNLGNLQRGTFLVEC